MTYCSRKSKISLGLGSSTRPSSLASASSSSMISLQRSMHSSQMYTPGPAISFLTCFWLFPQNEHLSRSPPSPNFATEALLPRVLLLVGALCGRYRSQLAVGDDFVDETVISGIGRAHDEVAVGVLLHTVDGLTRVECKDLVE